MNFTSLPDSRDLYGLYEITQAGEILYSRIRQRNALLNLQPETVGKNLFDDVLIFDNANAFRRQIESFWDGTENTKTFVFDSQFSKSKLPIKVRLIRANQSFDSNFGKFIIVDIRKNESNLRFY